MTTVKGSLRASTFSSAGVTKQDGVEKFLIPFSRFTGEEAGAEFAGCSILSPFNTVLIGRADFIPKPNYGTPLVMDMVWPFLTEYRHQMLVHKQYS